MTLQEKKEWVKSFLGDSFVRGVSINGYVATVVVKKEGIEREVIISLPNPDISTHKDR